MQDYTVAETRKIGEYEVCLFAIFDGYASKEIPAILKAHVFNNIMSEPAFLFDTTYAVRQGYLKTDTRILEKSNQHSFGGLGLSTSVTAILLNHYGQLNSVVANLGNSSAVICCNSGVAKQPSVHHMFNNETEKQAIERRSGARKWIFVLKVLPVTRAFGAKDVKKYLSCEPYMVVEIIDDLTEFLVLASHPVWKVMSNKKVVDSIRQIKNAQEAAKHLTQMTLNMPGYDHTDDISSLVVRFR